MNPSHAIYHFHLTIMKFTNALILMLHLPSSNLAQHLKGTRKTRALPISGPSPEEMCSAFMIYDFITRKMERELPDADRVNIDWSSACPPLQDLNPELCPTGSYLNDICAEPYRVNLNPSVKYDYCEPLLANIADDKDRLDCVRACVKYVSRDRGNCCQFKCEA